MAGYIKHYITLRAVCLSAKLGSYYKSAVSHVAPGYAMLALRFGVDKSGYQLD